MSGYTKRDIINISLTKLGIANYDFDVQPEMYDDLLKQLDLFIANLGADGINVGYSFASNPNDSDLDGQSGIARGRVLGVALNFAVLIASDFGKVVPQSLIDAAENALSALTESVVTPPKQVSRLTYGGGGNRYQSSVQTLPDNELTLGNTTLPFIPES